MRRVALAEHEQALVPEDGQPSLGVGVREPNKVEHERVEDFVRQCVFLVQQHADEQRCRPCVSRFRLIKKMGVGMRGATYRSSPYPRGG